jgi:hypothetical protein
MTSILDIGLPRRDPLSLPVLSEELEKLAMSATALAAARQATDSSPSEGKVEAGNYKKGKVAFHGLTVAIENPKGSTRSGTSSDGKKWSQKMHHDYGYFLGSEGKDGDHVDTFIGPDLDSELIFVVNQVLDGKFDEHKCVIGVTNEAAARKVYLDNYEDGWDGLGSITAMTLPHFKKWVLDRKATSKEAADKTIQAYKQFRTLQSRPGELLPLFIDNQNAVPQGEWIEGENIPTEGFAPRPGWHAGALPSAPHLRSKEDRIQPGRVWAEVELPDDVDWQSVADERPTKDIRDEVPKGGHYRKRTPQMQGGEWLIGGKLKVNQVLTDDQVSEILREAGELDAAEKERQKAAAERHPTKWIFSCCGKPDCDGCPGGSTLLPPLSMDED